MGTVASHQACQHPPMPLSLTRTARRPLIGVPAISEVATATLRNNGGIISHAAVGLSWKPRLAETLSSAGITPITGLTLTEVQQAWHTASAIPE